MKPRHYRNVLGHWEIYWGYMEGDFAQYKDTLVVKPGFDLLPISDLASLRFQDPSYRNEAKHLRLDILPSEKKGQHYLVYAEITPGVYAFGSLTEPASTSLTLDFQELAKTKMEEVKK